MTARCLHCLMVSGRSVRTFLLTSSDLRRARDETAGGMVPSSLSARFRCCSPWQWNRGLQNLDSKFMRVLYRVSINKVTILLWTHKYFNLSWTTNNVLQRWSSRVCLIIFGEGKQWDVWHTWAGLWCCYSPVSGSPVFSHRQIFHWAHHPGSSVCSPALSLPPPQPSGMRHTAELLPSANKQQ